MDGEIENLRKIADIARKTILETMEKYGSKISDVVMRGAYGSPSTRLDVEAEKRVIEFIEEQGFEYNIFTEEMGFIDRNGDMTLIMDPVDGSYNAEEGIPFYSVSLALTRKDLESVEYGFIKNVPLNTDYWAIRGGGAYKDGRKLKTNGKKRLYIIYLGSKATERAYNLSKRARRVRDMGSASLEMAMVAEGIADVFYYSFKESGALRIVDIAASYLLVKEAGGLVLDEDFNPLNMKLDFSCRKNVIALANEDLLEVVK